MGLVSDKSRFVETLGLSLEEGEELRFPVSFTAFRLLSALALAGFGRAGTWSRRRVKTVAGIFPFNFKIIDATDHHNS